MSDRVVIKSADRGAVLEFFAVDKAGSFRARLRGEGFEGTVSVSPYQTLPDTHIPAFFRDLAFHWRGWRFYLPCALNDIPHVPNIHLGSVGDGRSQLTARLAAGGKICRLLPHLPVATINGVIHRHANQALYQISCLANYPTTLEPIAAAPRFPKYHQLARVPEWAGAADEEA